MPIVQYLLQKLQLLNVSADSQQVNRLASLVSGALFTALFLSHGGNEEENRDCKQQYGDTAYQHVVLVGQLHLLLAGKLITQRFAVPGVIAKTPDALFFGYLPIIPF